MSHSCEKDQCSSCLWKPYHSCLTNKTQQECEASREHQWCGGHTVRLNKARQSSKVKRVRAATCESASSSGATNTCGTCSGCLWTLNGNVVGCYPWNQATCVAQDPTQYTWCGGNVPTPTQISCCDNSGNGHCHIVQDIGGKPKCPPGTSLISGCDSCNATVTCANPYYSGSSGTSSCGLNTILPNNAIGLARWLKIFPSLDPSSPQYASQNCGGLGVGRDSMWNAGCLMFGQGSLNGLSAFLQAASQFTSFANGPDPRKNIIELASFFGNVTQETGNPPNGGLVYSAELNSCQSSLFGKGPIQLTGAVNYQMATLGLNKPSDYNNLVTKQGTLTGACASNPNYVPSDDCWAQCASATPAAPPQGAGYNYCAKPWLASGLNDLGAVPKLDSVPAWSSALWYWMNVPINNSVAKTFYNIQGDVSCATAHNLIQDPMYNCGDWCPVAAIAQVGCPSCCVGPTSTLSDMTVNRVGNFVKLAAILGLPDAQGTAANNLFCTLLNTCSAGAPNTKGATCPANYSYQCYLDGTCGGGGGGGGSQVMCGNVKQSLPAPACVVVPGNNQAVTQAQCDSCLAPNTFWWPCNNSALCQWGSK